ncbi:MAG: asparagine synthase-related protein [Actinomycetaceae bacterium]|nr:asparagine synthase-related protein [Actinomycetaceae bacterium]
MQGNDNGQAVELLLDSPHWHREGDTHVWSMPAPISGVDWADLATTRGHWTAVRAEGGRIHIATDVVRSHPLVFAFVKNHWVVTDNVENLRTRVTWWRDEDAARVFRNTAFTLEDRTLIKDVYTTQAGSHLVLHPDGTTSTQFFFNYKFALPAITDAAEYDAEFSAGLDAALGRLLDQAGSRQLVLPLSGGLDSRLLACWLRKLGAANVLAFTYGKVGAPEVEISRKVAAELGIKWFAVDMDPAVVSRKWRSQAGTDFVRATWKGTSLPHVQDWFALCHIRENQLISADAIILPGHTVVGNMHDEHLLQGATSEKQIAQAIINYHLSLQGNPGKDGKEWVVRRAVRNAFEQVGFPRTPRSVQAAIEWFNVRERQAKYINNSMAAYEYFGYAWALPMLDQEMWQVWAKGSVQLTATRQWYTNFTHHVYEQVTGTPLGLFTQRSLMKPSPVKDALLWGMRAARLDRALERVRSTRAMLDHPMSFEAFTGKKPLTQARLYLAGNTQMGLWTDEFLANTWTGPGDVVPQ